MDNILHIKPTYHIPGVNWRVGEKLKDVLYFFADVNTYSRSSLEMTNAPFSWVRLCVFADDSFTEVRSSLIKTISTPTPCIATSTKLTLIMLEYGHVKISFRFCLLHRCTHSPFVLSTRFIKVTTTATSVTPTSCLSYTSVRMVVDLNFLGDCICLCGVFLVEVVVLCFLFVCLFVLFLGGLGFLVGFVFSGEGVSLWVFCVFCCCFFALCCVSFCLFVYCFHNHVSDVTTGYTTLSLNKINQLNERFMSAAIILSHILQIPPHYTQCQFKTASNVGKVCLPDKGRYLVLACPVYL